MTNYLPSGSVVTLTPDRGYWMIAGYFPHTEDDRVYDYFAVPFPLGLLSLQGYTCFNQEEITSIVHTGFCDETCQSVLNNLVQLRENMSTLAEKLKEGHNHE